MVIINQSYDDTPQTGNSGGGGGGAGDASTIPPPSALWYAFRDSTDGRLLIETASPFLGAALGDTWNMQYTDGRPAYGYLIGINIVSSGNDGIAYLYESTPEATAPTPVVWGLRDTGGVLYLETVNPTGGGSGIAPLPAWNMRYTTGQPAYGMQSIFEIVTSISPDIKFIY